ncbi:hypothetical protein [Kribbella monticola]|uniref:hypothetical protein n=1 Tax=Kribbella monticola TaxID=2185285 RepID=UPI000DD39A01|nr:hypothetical protein [Kribbella monticola]
MPSTPPPLFTLSAWIDESLIIDSRDVPDTYMMAAVVADQDDCEDLRATMLDLVVRPGVRLHWVAESAKRRDLIAHQISTLDIAAIVAIGAPMDRSRQERARRCCLECLLYELDKFGVSRVWLESRAAAQDRRDLRLVDSARYKGLISRELSVDFAQPVQEPMVWLPDAVAGAVAAARRGEPRWLLMLSESVDVREVRVR